MLDSQTLDSVGTLDMFDVHDAQDTPVTSPRLQLTRVSMSVMIYIDSRTPDTVGCSWDLKLWVHQSVYSTYLVHLSHPDSET